MQMLFGQESGGYLLLIKEGKMKQTKFPLGLVIFDFITYFLSKVASAIAEALRNVVEDSKIEIPGKTFSLPFIGEIEIPGKTCNNPFLAPLEGIANIVEFVATPFKLLFYLLTVILILKLLLMVIRMVIRMIKSRKAAKAASQPNAVVANNGYGNQQTVVQPVSQSQMQQIDSFGSSNNP